jgi:hypothetical protein
MGQLTIDKVDVKRHIGTSLVRLVLQLRWRISAHQLGLHVQAIEQLGLAIGFVAVLGVVRRVSSIQRRLLIQFRSIKNGQKWFYLSRYF